MMIANLVLCLHLLTFSETAEMAVGGLVVLLSRYEACVYSMSCIIAMSPNILRTYYLLSFR